MKKNAKGYLRSTFTIDGKRYTVYGKNNNELFEKESKKRAEIEQRINTRENPTVEEYCSRRLEFRKDGISYNTYRNIKRAMNSICKIHINSVDLKFGEIKLKKVSSDDLKEVQNALKKTCKTSTVNDHMSKLKHMFCDAVRERIIIYNPFDMITNIKRTEEKARETYHRALNLQEQEKFFNSDLTKRSKYYNIFCFAINTGMRIGEIGALKYKDIKSDHIYVQRTITRTHGDTFGIGEDTKTSAGIRKIPINDSIRKIIDRQKALNEKRVGCKIIDLEAILFTAPRGGLIYDQYVNAEIKKICQAEEIETFTSHSFRDTFATRAIENGMKPKTLQEILGHKDYGMTMNLYCHVMEDTKVQEMNNLRIMTQ